MKGGVWMVTFVVVVTQKDTNKTWTHYVGNSINNAQLAMEDFDPQEHVSVLEIWEDEFMHLDIKQDTLNQLKQ
jgi:hypothetical protein